MTLLPAVFFSDGLIGEIFSVLPVKSILRFRCLSKSCDTLISDPNFVKLQLKRSSATPNPHFLLIIDQKHEIKGESPYGSDDEFEEDSAVIPYSIRCLIDNPSFTISMDPYSTVKDKGCSRIVGSCNGLICLAGSSFTCEYIEYWLRLWNPATRITSPIFGYFREKCNSLEDVPFLFDGNYKFYFGYDDSTDTYKVLAARYNRRELRSNVRILGFGDNNWRHIESFPVDPISLDYDGPTGGVSDGVYFRSTLNWLAIQNQLQYILSTIKDITVENFVIVSFDLRTETYNRYFLPRDFDEVPPAQPTIGVLGDCLCFSYCYKETDFVIWHMKKFGVEDSWTPFLKISYQNLQIDYDYSFDFMKYHFNLQSLFLSEDGDTLILDSSQEMEAILYNLRDNTVRRTEASVSSSIIDHRTNVRTSTSISWYMAMDYVESLVSIC